MYDRARVESRLQHPSLPTLPPALKATELQTLNHHHIPTSEHGWRQGPTAQ